MYILNSVKELKEEKSTFHKKLFMVGKEALLRIMKALPRRSYGNFPRHQRYNEGGGTRLNSRLHSSTLGLSWHQDSLKPCQIPF